MTNTKNDENKQRNPDIDTKEILLDPDDSLKSDDFSNMDDPYYTVKMNKGDVGDEVTDTFDENLEDPSKPNDPLKTLSSKTVAGEFAPGQAGHQGDDEGTE